MERRLSIPEVTDWLYKGYFVTKFSPGDPTAKRVSQTYAQKMLNGGDKWKNCEDSLAGHLAEPLFIGVLREFSPEGYNVDPSDEYLDKRGGCDVAIKRGGNIIGGFSLKTGTSEGTRRHSYTPPFRVMTIRLHHLEPQEIFISVQNGVLPDMYQMGRRRIRSRQSDALLGQLYDEVANALHSCPKGEFKNYLQGLAQNVAAFHSKHKAS